MTDSRNEIPIKKHSSSHSPIRSIMSKALSSQVYEVSENLGSVASEPYTLYEKHLRRARVKELAARKEHLSIVELIELSVLAPQELVQLEIEDKFRNIVHEQITRVLVKTSEMTKQMEEIDKKIKYVSQEFRMHEKHFRAVPGLEVDVLKIRNDLMMRTQDHNGILAVQDQVHQKIIHNWDLVMTRMDGQQQQITKLDEIVHKPTDVDEKIMNLSDQLTERMKKELNKLLKQVLESVARQDNMATETKFKVDRIDRMYERMKTDIGRHETLCFELATKFNEQHDVIIKLSETMESLKTYSIMNDLHLEAYLPLQVASIAYDVGKGLLNKKTLDRYKKHFATKVVKDLEKNCIMVCDPSVNQSSLKYGKCNYKIPNYLASYVSQESNKWDMVLEKITLANINLYSMPEDNKPQRQEELSDPRSDVAIQAIRRCMGNQKFMMLTNQESELSEEAMKFPLQRKFEWLMKRNFDELKQKINLTQLKNFHQMSMSKIKEMLNYAGVDKQSLVLFSDKSTTDEKIVANYKALRKVQSQKRREEALLRGTQDAIIEEPQSDECANSEYENISMEGEDIDGNKIVTRQKVKKVNQNEIELALYSGDHMRNARQQEDSSDGEINADFLKHLHGNDQTDIIKEMTEERIEEAEKLMNEKFDSALKNIRDELELGEILVKRDVMQSISKTNQDFAAQFKIINKQFDQNLADKISEIQDEMSFQENNLITVVKHQIKEALRKIGNEELESQKSISSCDSSSQSSSSLSKESIKLPLNQLKQMPAPKDSSMSIHIMGKKRPPNMLKTEKNRLKMIRKKTQVMMQDLEDAFRDPDRQESTNNVINTFQQQQLKSSQLANPMRKKSSSIIGAKIQSHVKGLVSGTLNNNKVFKQFEANQKQPGGAMDRVMTQVKRQQDSTNKILQNINLGNFSQIGSKNYNSFSKKVNGSPGSSFNISPRGTRHTGELSKKVLKIAAAASPLMTSSYNSTKQPMTPFKKQSTIDLAKKMAIFSASPVKIQINDKDVSPVLIKRINEGPKKIIVKKDQLKNKEKNQKNNTAAPIIMNETRIGYKSRKLTGKVTVVESNEDSDLTSESGCFSSDQSGGSSLDLKNYVTVDDLGAFKKELMEVQSGINQEILLIRVEMDAFQQETVKTLDRIDNIDWKLMRKAEMMAAQSAAEFKALVDEFENSMSHDLKRWKRKQTDLASKYEHVTLWVSMQMKMNQKLKGEIHESQTENRTYLESLAKQLSLQIMKDNQDDIDRSSLGLYGMQERGVQKIVGSPVSGDKSENGMNVIDRVQNNIPFPSGAMSVGIESTQLSNQIEKKNLMHAFQLACLNYQSSLVPLKSGEKKSRKEVTAIQTNNLNNLCAQLKIQQQRQNDFSAVLEEMNEINPLTNNGQQTEIQPRFLQGDVNKTFEKIMSVSKHDIFAEEIQDSDQSASKNDRVLFSNSKRILIQQKVNPIIQVAALNEDAISDDKSKTNLEINIKNKDIVFFGKNSRNNMRSNPTALDPNKRQVQNQTGVRIATPKSMAQSRNASKPITQWGSLAQISSNQLKPGENSVTSSSQQKVPFATPKISNMTPMKIQNKSAKVSPTNFARSFQEKQTTSPKIISSAQTSPKQQVQFFSRAQKKTPTTPNSQTKLTQYPNDKRPVTSNMSKMEIFNVQRSYIKSQKQSREKI